MEWRKGSVYGRDRGSGGIELTMAATWDSTSDGGMWLYVSRRARVLAGMSGAYCANQGTVLSNLSL